MTQEELNFLNKVNSQIQDYIQLGFNQYGLRVSTSGNPLVDTLENSVADRNISSLTVDKLLAGTITVSVDVGNGNCKIDGSSNRFIVNDGTNDRCLMGYLEGKF